MRKRDKNQIIMFVASSFEKLLERTYPGENGTVLRLQSVEKDVVD